MRQAGGALPKLLTERRGQTMDYIVIAAPVISIFGLPASALLGVGIWALRRDTRAPVQAVAVLLMGLGAALWLVTLLILLVLVTDPLVAGSP